MGLLDSISLGLPAAALDAGIGSIISSLQKVSEGDIAGGVGEWADAVAAPLLAPANLVGGLVGLDLTPSKSVKNISAAFDTPPTTGGTNVAYELESSQWGALTGSTVGLSGYKKKRRSMNVCNVRALRRSQRRLEGFVHLAKKLVSFQEHAHLKHPKHRRK